MSKIVFISYPKSGRTWIHKIFEKYESFSGSKVKQGDKVIRTHLGYGGNEQKKIKQVKEVEAPQYVLLTRDRPDTLVSFFHDEKVRKFRGGAKGSIDDFVLEYKPLIDKFYTEIERYDFDYQFTYEDMQESPLETVLPFAHLIYGDSDVDIGTLRRAIEFCDFDNLSKLERENKEDMQVIPAHKKDNFYKTRKGQVGSALEELKPETLKKLL